MKIVLTKKELDKLYIFTRRLNNSEANIIFNGIFTEDHNKMLEIVSGIDELTVSVDDEIALPFMEVFIKNAPLIATLFRSNKLSVACNIKTVVANLGADIRTAKSIADKIWRTMTKRRDIA